MRNLAIIPARSGSKGLVDKNIKMLCGKPLVAYSIEAAVKSNCFDEVMVSTDSEKYASIAKEWGASVPFLRSNENSSDSASSMDMIQEVLMKYKELGKEFDTVCLLQPTSPLRVDKDIVDAYALLHDKDAESVVSVVPEQHSPLWSNVIPDDLSLDSFLRPEVKNTPRQNLPTHYRLNGAVYIMKVKEENRLAKLYSEGCYAYIMPSERSVDIDTNIDFLFAETLLKSGEGLF